MHFDDAMSTPLDSTIDLRSARLDPRARAFEHAP
jgi:hypothetical protein